MTKQPLCYLPLKVLRRQKKPKHELSLLLFNAINPFQITPFKWMAKQPMSERPRTLLWVRGRGWGDQLGHTSDGAVCLNNKETLAFLWFAPFGPRRLLGIDGAGRRRQKMPRSYSMHLSGNNDKQSQTSNLYLENQMLLPLLHLNLSTEKRRTENCKLWFIIVNNICVILML